MNSKIYALILLLLAGVGCTNEQNKPGAKNTHPLLLISFDGFRHDYLSKAETPNFDQFAKEGVKAAGLIPVFPSKTFPNHYSIATGLYPEHTGLVGNTMYDPQFDAWYHISDRHAVENPRWYGGEPIWTTAEKQGLKAGTLFWVGSEAPIENMRPTHWKSYDESLPFKARIDTVVKWLAAPDSQSVDFATLYFDQPDHAGHRYGPQSDSVAAAVKRADALVDYLKQKMQSVSLWDSTNIIILSDHGMAELSADKIITLDQIIDTTKVKRQILGPVTMLQPKPGTEEALYQSLKKHENHYRIFKKENLPHRYHLKNNRRVFDLVMVADLGYTILTSKYKSQFLQSLPAGTHGYDNRNEQMQALFMARGPSFKKGIALKAFQNVHLYDLMAQLLHINPAPTDGSLDSVRVMLEK